MNRTRYLATWALLKLAGVEGFEPPYGGIKTRCLTAWRHPNLKSTISVSPKPILSRSLIFQARASRSVREPKNHLSPAATFPRFRGRDQSSQPPKKYRPQYPSGAPDRSPTANRSRAPLQDIGAARRPGNRFVHRTPGSREL